jgi:hypothetical protein
MSWECNTSIIYIKRPTNALGFIDAIKITYINPSAFLGLLIYFINLTVAGNMEHNTSILFWSVTYIYNILIWCIFTKKKYNLWLDIMYVIFILFFKNMFIKKPRLV